jgi:hypothetical protein
VRQLPGLDDPNAQAVEEGANGLVQTVEPGVGAVRLLGGVVKVDGAAGGQTRPAPALNEHARELLGRK